MAFKGCLPVLEVLVGGGIIAETTSHAALRGVKANEVCVGKVLCYMYVYKAVYRIHTTIVHKLAGAL